MPAYLSHGLYGYVVKFAAVMAASLITVVLFVGGASVG